MTPSEFSKFNSKMRNASAAEDEGKLYGIYFANKIF
jgi:hypothetical protein